MIGFSFRSASRNLSAPSLAALLMLAASASTASAASTFDHAVFDRLLERAVVGGRVNYATFRSQPVFDAYLATLATARPQKLSTNERLAFWINAYNAFTIKNVVDNPGMTRPTEITGFFDRKKFSVAGQSLTLNEIENSIVRPQFREPLIHFGLVCAAVNCPPILPHAYTGRTIRRDLEANARAYLASAAFNRYDARTKTLQLSKIFDWYKADFGGEAGVRRFVRMYGTALMKKEVTATTPITYLEYNWALNSR